MAKSMRSKWKRKCRAVKRERYNKKELELLKKTLSNDPCNKPSDVDMNDVSALVTVVDEKAIKVKQQDDDKMAMDTNTKPRIFNPRTMKDQHGTFPIWMNQRKISKHRKGAKGKGKGKGKGKIKKEKTEK